MRRPGAGRGLSPPARGERGSVRGPGPLLRGDAHRGAAVLAGGRRGRRRSELGRAGRGQVGRQRARGPCRRPAEARAGDVALPRRSDRGQVERPRLVGVRGTSARGRRQARGRRDRRRRPRSTSPHIGGVRNDRRLAEVGGTGRLRRPGRQGLRRHRRGGGPPPGLRSALGRGGPGAADARVHASRHLRHRRRPQRIDQACGGCGRGRRAGGPLHPRVARVGPSGVAATDPAPHSTGEADPRSAAVTFVTTEHFVLQGARAATVAEANGRANMFLAAVSGGLVALGLVATASSLGAAFYGFGLILLPTLTFVGLVTFGRVLQSGIEDTEYARRIARPRGYYLEHAPEIAPYLLRVSPAEQLIVQPAPGNRWQGYKTVAGVGAGVTAGVAGAAPPPRGRPGFSFPPRPAGGAPGGGGAPPPGGAG